MQISLRLLPLVAAVVPLTGILVAAPMPAPAPVIVEAPPQDQGLPYTRSARKVGLAKIHDQIGVFAGSRYAYVKGFKVRLDQSDILHGEAVLQDEDVKKVELPPAPSYLAERWVYTLPLPHGLKAPLETRQLNGKPYVALGKLAVTKGLKVFRNSRGLLLIGNKAASFTDAEGTLLETVITLFDTPEKFADPDIATRNISTLRRQGKWTDRVKVTPEQLALLNGPETNWPTAPKSSYDYSGFNASLLGSKVPKPGVYPRILFSLGDVPALDCSIRFHARGGVSHD